MEHKLTLYLKGTLNMASQAIKDFRRIERKEKRKERREKFQKEHPALAEFLLKAQVTIAVVTAVGIPFALGYSMRMTDEKTQKIFDETQDDLERAMDRWCEGPKDYIDDEKKYHQDIGFGCFAVWPDAETYLNAETKRVKALSENT